MWAERWVSLIGVAVVGHQAKPDDANVHLLMAEAFTYSTSSKGIVKAAVTGDGFKFMR